MKTKRADQYVYTFNGFVLAVYKLDDTDSSLC